MYAHYVRLLLSTKKADSRSIRIIFSRFAIFMKIHILYFVE